MVDLKFNISASDETSKGFAKAKKNFDSFQGDIEKSKETFDKLSENIKGLGKVSADFDLKNQVEQTKSILKNLRELEKPLKKAKDAEAKKLLGDIKSSKEEANKLLDVMQKMEKSGGGSRASQGGRGATGGAATGGGLGGMASDILTKTGMSTVIPGLGIALGLAGGAIKLGQVYAQQAKQQSVTSRVTGQFEKKGISDIGATPAQVAQMRASAAREIGSEASRGKPSDVFKDSAALYNKYGIDYMQSAGTIAKMKRLGMGEEGIAGLTGAAEYAGVGDARMGMFYDTVSSGFIEAVESGSGVAFEDMAETYSDIMSIGAKYQGEQARRMFQTMDNAIKSAADLQGGPAQGRILQALIQANPGMSMWDLKKQARKGAGDPSNIRAIMEFNKQLTGGGESGLMELQGVFRGFSEEQTEDIRKLYEQDKSGQSAADYIEKAKTSGVPELTDDERAATWNVRSAEELDVEQAEVMLSAIVAGPAYEAYKKSTEIILQIATTASKSVEGLPKIFNTVGEGFDKTFEAMKESWQNASTEMSQFFQRQMAEMAIMDWPGGKTKEELLIEYLGLDKYNELGRWASE